jgi:hypothetical protein
MRFVDVKAPLAFGLNLLIPPPGVKLHRYHSKGVTKQVCWKLLKIKGPTNDVERFANEGCRGGGVVRTGEVAAQLHGEYYHKGSYSVQYFFRLLKGKGIGLGEARRLRSEIGEKNAPP